ncbi:MAG TPA: uroporphyrinogen-III C-methyltransferase [Burkholderiaceae bacterium]|nr:uroporphyrinogen-III C-methyltransferase [Burkholderiaceae bacterium]
MAGNLPWLLPALGVVALLAGFAAWTAWDSREQARGLELELVRRQQGSTEQAAEARSQSKQAQELARDAAAKVALLEAKLADVTLQRSQLEELVQSLSRSRDENVVADIDASVRVAMQQSALSGSAEPLMAALRTADERLGRINQPRLERLRRAVVRDLDRVRSAGVPDVGALLIKLDEAVRLADELPLTAQAAHQATYNPARPAPAAAGASAAARKSASGSATGEGTVAAWQALLDDWSRPLQSAWAEVRALLRVTRIDHPEAMLLAPEQGFFLRENLKLRLLNARLSLLSRQAEATVSDLQLAANAVQAYFDGGSRKTQLLLELLRQVQGQSRQLGVPRPDETLAATATTAAAAVAR